MKKNVESPEQKCENVLERRSNCEQEEMTARRKKMRKISALIASVRALGQALIGQGLEEDLKREIVTQIWRQDKRRQKGGCSLTTVTQKCLRQGSEIKD